MTSLLFSAFEKVLVDRPSETAILDLRSRRPLCFADLGLEFRAVKQAFERSVDGRGALVISLVGNHPTWFAVFLASLARGNVLLPLDAETSWVEAEGLAARYGASAIVAPPEHAGSGPAPVPLPGGLALYPRSSSPFADFGSASLLKLTSGTSDEPRAVLVSESNQFEDGAHIVEAMGIRPGDVNYGVISLSHSYGLGNLVLPLFLQGTPIALRDRFLPAKVGEDLETGKATVFPGVPFHFERLLAQSGGRPLPDSLRLLVSAGAHLEALTAQKFHDRLGRKIHPFYGSSETGGITYDDSEELSAPPHVGSPMPGTEVTLRSDSRSSSGQRIFVRGGAVARGYAGGLERERGSEFVDGGFLTGDTGEFDERGRLSLTGRVSSFVNVAGRKVNPREVERVLLEMTGVSQAVVLGLSCERRGQKLVAFVVPRTVPLSPVELRTFCAGKLSAYKIPREIIFVDSLPVNGRGKLDRRALEELVR